MFTESILDETYDSKITDGEAEGWTLDELQLNLCAHEQRLNARIEKLAVLKVRRAMKDSPSQGGGDPTPSTHNGAGGGGNERTPKAPSDKTKDTWKQLRMTIEKNIGQFLVRPNRRSSRA